MKSYLRAILTLVLIAYLAVALVMTRKVSAAQRCGGITIEVNDSASRRFVTAAEIARDLGPLYTEAPRMRLADIDTERIERELLENDRIESATVVRLSDGSIRITVDPMIPVARVFDGNRSYYINKDGKHMSAGARYHTNVPVVSGRFSAFDSTFTAASVLPLVDYIASDSLWNNFVTMIKVDSPTDIILVPMIRGHVVNLGSIDNLPDKFGRLTTFYKKVFPTKGWQYYDSVSVKWAGQVVATRRVKAVEDLRLASEEEGEEVDVNTMLVADNVAPGQTKVTKEKEKEKEKSKSTKSPQP